MMEKSIILIIFSGLTSFVSFTHVNELTQPGMIFSRLHAFCTSRLPYWLHKPLISCERCVAGQLFFWGFIYLTWSLKWSYDPLLHFYGTYCCILSTKYISQWLAKIDFPERTPKKSDYIPPELRENNKNHGAEIH